MLIFTFGYLAPKEKSERLIAQQNELIAWQKEGCPVFKSECGSKSKYPCEQKAAVVGRNSFGNIFVDAYPTCQKPQ